MTRLASFVYLINTFLPILAVVGMVLAAQQVASAVAVSVCGVPGEKASDEERGAACPRLHRLEAERQKLLAGITAAETALDSAGKRIKIEAARIKDAADKVGKPFKAMTEGLGKVADAIAKVKVAKIGKILSTPFRLLQGGLTAMNKLTAPLSRITKAASDAVAALGNLRLELAALDRAIADLQDGYAVAEVKIAEFWFWAKWTAIAIGPWIVLSYLCWIWIRLRRWRVMAAGRIA